MGIHTALKKRKKCCVGDSKQPRGRGGRVYGYSQCVDEKEGRSAVEDTEETAKKEGCQMKTKRKQNCEHSKTKRIFERSRTKRLSLP